MLVLSQKAFGTHAKKQMSNKYCSFFIIWHFAEENVCILDSDLSYLGQWGEGNLLKMSHNLFLLYVRSEVIGL